ncbi:hypothetical protein DY000_02054423 [Brassica cretica]|uniref:Uncharacterized protein n=1 Tax=Brassica cretica TaxID=69181 RepID=A0ABQ7AFQ4_BRACR|nr:hypothetical protein DY000_02054423 [Brassica cretica]
MNERPKESPRAKSPLSKEGPAVGELAKQHRTHKRSFKPTGIAAGSTKMRIANALVKRAAARTSTRH